jgi:hypothetical protein
LAAGIIKFPGLADLERGAAEEDDFLRGFLHEISTSNLKFIVEQ